MNTTDTAVYPFDQKDYEVELNVSTNPDRERLIHFKFRRPTDAEEIKRESDSWVQLKGDDQISNRDKADEAYFDLLLIETKGILTPGEGRELAGEWRPVTPAILEALTMYPQWKREAVAGLRGGTATLSEATGEDEDFTVIGASVTIPVDYFFPDEENPQYTVHFEVPAPSEREKKQYEDKIVRVDKSKRRNGPTRIIADLQVGSDLFMTLLNRPGADITGATVQGRTFSEMSEPLQRSIFLNSINPVIRARVIGAAMTKYIARLRD